MEDAFEQFKARADQNKKNKNDSYKDNSKRRLLNNLKKKFDTTIIGSLAAFEDRFGELWGHGASVEELDEDQLYWREVWTDTRSKVLDNGNANLRAAQNEIAQYTLSWNRYVTQFNLDRND
jgi:hypothetical protein|tara:strand:+ start:306 stop:668 length:363 start_codon:yes stop_codon:yes gene_type:complete